MKLLYVFGLACLLLTFVLLVTAILMPDRGTWKRVGNMEFYSYNGMVVGEVYQLPNGLWEARFGKCTDAMALSENAAKEKVENWLNDTTLKVFTENCSQED